MHEAKPCTERSSSEWRGCSASVLDLSSSVEVVSMGVPSVPVHIDGDEERRALAPDGTMEIHVSSCRGCLNIDTLGGPELELESDKELGSLQTQHSTRTRALMSVWWVIGVDPEH